MAKRKNSSLWDYDPIAALVKAGVDSSRRFQKSPYVGLDPIAALGSVLGKAVQKSSPRSGAKKMPSKPAPNKPKRKPMPTKPGAKPSRKPMPARPSSKPARKPMPYKKAR